MSVDFFDCDSCGESVCECGPYVRCEGCDNKFCTTCHKGKGLREDDLDGEDTPSSTTDDEGNPDLSDEEVVAKVEACPVCSLRMVTDSQLVSFLLKKLGWSRKKGEKEYRASKRKVKTDE